MADDATRPTCPVCLELAFNALVGRCGHTLCEQCKNALPTTKCPVCRKGTTYAPNYTVRQILEHPRFDEELKQRRKEALLATPKGFLDHMAVKYPDFKIVHNDLDVGETVMLLRLAEKHVTEKLLFSEIEQFRQQYDPSLMIISFVKNVPYLYSMPGGKHYKIVAEFNGTVFIAVCQRSKFAKTKKRRAASPAAH